jgi:hypothetical protein
MSPVVSKAVAFIFQENSHLTATNEKLKLRQHYSTTGLGPSLALANHDLSRNQAQRSSRVLLRKKRLESANQDDMKAGLTQGQHRSDAKG